MNSLNLNIFNAIILAGIIHGVIFSLVIFFNKKFNSRTNFYLAYTILALAFSNLQYWLIDVEISPGYENNNIIFIPFEFLMLPFFYLFIKSYLNKKIRIIEKIVLFTPFTLSVLYQIIGDRIEINNRTIEFLNLVIEYISILFSISIILIVFWIIIKHDKEKSSYNTNTVVIKTGWIKRTLILGLILCVLWVLSLNVFDNFINNTGYYKFYPLWIGIAILIYWMGYSSIFQSNILRERTNLREKRISKISTAKTEIAHITNSESQTFDALQSTIKQNKLYLNPNLSLNGLAQELKLSKGYISQLINKNSGVNFNDYINLMRVEDAKLILGNNEFDNYTITAIGLESGFNSKSSFYTAFKKFTDKTPVEYKKSVRNL